MTLRWCWLGRGSSGQFSDGILGQTDGVDSKNGTRKTVTVLERRMRKGWPPANKNLSSQLTPNGSRTNVTAEGVGGVSCSALSAVLNILTIRSFAESAANPSQESCLPARGQQFPNRTLVRF